MGVATLWRKGGRCRSRVGVTVVIIEPAVATQSLHLLVLSNLPYEQGGKVSRQSLTFPGKAKQVKLFKSVAIPD